MCQIPFLIAKCKTGKAFELTLELSEVSNQGSKSNQNWRRARLRVGSVWMSVLNSGYITAIRCPLVGRGGGEKKREEREEGRPQCRHGRVCKWNVWKQTLAHYNNFFLVAELLSNKRGKDKRSIQANTSKSKISVFYFPLWLHLLRFLFIST